ncbi:glycosyltransferase [Candidatus Parcubacteria bacterium]|nr:glycosyltransferase [Candidatus Parcubacteria bacterium]
MRIAFYSDTFLPQINGVVRSLVTLAETLRDRGHQIEIHTATSSTKPLSLLSHDRNIIRKTTARLSEDAQLPGCQIIRYPSFTLPFYPQYRVVVPTLRRWRRIKTAPQIIHTHTPFGAGWEAVAAAKHLRRPLVGTHHTLAEKFRTYLAFLPASFGRKISLKYAAAYYRRCDTILASSRAVADELKKGGLNKPVTWVSNPLDLGRFVGSASKAELKAHFGLSDPSLLYHGRIAAENRLELLLEAAAELKNSAPGVTLAIAGDGPTMPKLKQLAERLGLKGAVKFTGMLHGQDLANLITASDIFVSPSDSENQSMALLEAMAAGLAIVAVRGGGTPEHVREGENAFLAAPGDRSSLASGALRLLQNQELRARFGLASKELAQRFDRHQVAQELEKIYDSLV